MAACDISSPPRTFMHTSPRKRKTLVFAGTSSSPDDLLSPSKLFAKDVLHKAAITSTGEITRNMRIPRTSASATWEECLDIPESSQRDLRRQDVGGDKTKNKDRVARSLLNCGNEDLMQQNTRTGDARGLRTGHRNEDALIIEEGLDEILVSRSGSKVINRNEGDQKSHVEGVALKLKPRPQEREAERQIASSTSLGLEKSLPRRKEWTPVKDRSVTRKSLTPETICSSLPILSSPDNGRNNERSFEMVINGFDYKPEQATATPMCSNLGEKPMVTKKRKITMLDQVFPQSKPGVVRDPKSPTGRKKPQTITSKATGHYIDTYRQDSGDVEEICGPPVTVQAVHSDITNGTTRKKGKETVACKRRAKTKATKSKKVVQVPRPPEDAIRAQRGQNLLFGTSSQLLRDDFGSLSSQKCVSMNPSNAADREDASFVDVDDMDLPVLSNSPAGIGLNATKALWSAAARDLQGSLHRESRNSTLLVPENKERSLREDAPVIEIFDEPGQQTVTEPGLSPSPITVPSKSNSHPQSRTWPSDVPMLVPKPASLQPLPMPPHNMTTLAPAPAPAPFQQPVLQHSVTEAGLRRRSISPTKKSPITDEHKSRNEKIQELCGDSTQTMPNFDSYSTDQLARAIKNYGFKPIKNRARMTALLQKCWESKTRLALQSVTSNAKVGSKKKANGEGGDEKHEEPMPKDKPELNEKETHLSRRSDFEVDKVIVNKHKKPRGRPRKNAQSLGALNEDVAESAEADSHQKAFPPQPSAKSKKASDAEKSPSKSKKPSHSVVETPDVQSLSQLQRQDYSGSAKSTAWPSDEANGSIMAKITEAIMTFPPSHDASKPSWREKIVMYDPIVLEDLAAWLNTVGLGRVGVDEEVSPGIVREWCESKSVCCLWKMNLRGGQRTRY